MTVKNWNRMIRRMRRYVSQGKTFDRFRSDNASGYQIAWSTMRKAWEVAEMQVLGHVREADMILTYK